MSLVREFIDRIPRPIKDAVKRTLGISFPSDRVCAAVAEASRMDPRSLTGILEDADLVQIREQVMLMPRLESVNLFNQGDSRLPCWLPGDETLLDDWLLASDNYPLYYNLFMLLSSGAQQISLLEIGVRTGYIAVVFFRAVNCERQYIGVDPNEYVRNGLSYAEKTLHGLMKTDARFKFRLINGYSTDEAIQARLLRMPKFDLVHIDGDHSLVGKLRDLEFVRHLLSPSGVVLVDDVKHVPHIEDAVARSLALGWYKRVCYVPTKRGLALLG